MKKVFKIFYLTVWVPDVCDELHLGWPEGILLREVDMSFKKSTLTVAQ